MQTQITNLQESIEIYSTELNEQGIHTTPMLRRQDAFYFENEEGLEMDD
ncbi:2512_t:CDS:2, partial [Racocetra persica]